MIENYKGWDITLNWDNKDYLERDTTKSNFFNRFYMGLDQGRFKKTC